MHLAKSDSTTELTRSFHHPSTTSDVAGSRVLVVEPDAALRLFLKRELTSYGLHVCLCRDGEHALAELHNSRFDIVIQDMDLPGMDGMTLLHSLHSQYPQMPVMVLTGRGRTEDRVEALDRGAEDYIVKPFSLRELHARVRSQLRRASVAPAVKTGESAVQQEKLSLSKLNRRVLRGDRQIDLTPREFALLEHLVEHEGEAVSRATLMEEVWNTPFDPSTNIIDVYMKYLRDKIDGAGEKKLIRTVRGVGYMLDAATAVAFA